MYRQVMLTPEQRPLQRILWRETPEQQIETFELSTVTYGTTAASFLVIRCLEQLASECEDKRPQIAKIIRKDFYVDDLLSGGENIEEVISTAKEISKVLAGGRFELRKWNSNSSKFRENFTDTNKAQTEIQLNKDGNKRTLGLIWRVKDDTLTYSVNLPNNSRVTKRNILSTASMIFDPLGLLAPCTIIAKILIQTLWVEKLSWDESLPSSLHSRWTQYYNQLNSLNNFVIRRQAVAPDAVKIQIHGFADASKDAYGACIYIHTLDNKGEIHVNLLCAKTKVAPLKTQTIPRLELCAALMLARLTATVERDLEIDIDAITYWSDSTIVLAWLQSQPSSLPVFESNRVARIQELSNKGVWRHVPTSQNPADLLSRGIQPQNLNTSTLWWHGPAFLKDDSKTWPDQFLCTMNTPLTKLVLSTINIQNDTLDNLLTQYSKPCGFYLIAFVSQTR